MVVTAHSPGKGRHRAKKKKRTTRYPQKGSPYFKQKREPFLLGFCFCLCLPTWQTLAKRTRWQTLAKICFSWHDPPHLSQIKPHYRPRLRWKFHRILILYSITELPRIHNLVRLQSRKIINRLNVVFWNVHLQEEEVFWEIG